MTPEHPAAIAEALPIGHKVSSRNIAEPSRLTNLLLPSLSDLFFVALIGWLFLSHEKGWSQLLVDADIGWHIRTGEYILAHHSVPQHDLYSFSKAGAPWFAWEWLSDVLAALLHGWAGLKGVVLAAGVIIAWFSVTLIQRMIRAGAHPFAALLVALSGVGASSIHFLARPHVITLLLLSVSMWVIERDRRRSAEGAPDRRVWWLVPISLIWTNLHGGFLILVVLLGLAAVGAAAQAWLEREALDQNRWNAWMTGAQWSAALRYTKLTAACAAVTFINPYGWGLHAHIIEYLRSDWIRKVVNEFQSPSFRGESMLQFEALLFIGLMAAAANFKRHHITEGLWILLCSYLSLSSSRHLPVYVAAVSPLVAIEISNWWSTWTAGAGRKSALTILNQIAKDMVPGFQRTSCIPFIGVAALAAIGAPIHWPTDFPSEMFPTAMIHKHEKEIFGARVMTTDQWADYLIYLHPAQKVYVDGRSDFYGPAVGNEFLHAVNGAPDWQQVMNQRAFQVVLLPVDTPLVQLLKQSREWRVTDDDGKQILLVRK